MRAEEPSVADTFAIPSSPERVGPARERVVAAGAPVMDSARQAELRLLASEVISNAITHGGDGDRVEIRTLLCDGFICVKVTDSGPGIAPKPRATAPERDGGFGLVLVEHLSRRWGMTRESGRTRIWFEFDF